MTITNTITKTIFAGALTLAVFAMPAGTALAASFNDHANDRETLRVKNSAGSFSTSGWSTSVSAQPGDTISFAIYYHNTASDDAQNTRVTLSPQSTGTAGSHTFTATVSADNAPTTSGSVNVFASPQASLSFVSGSVQWYPNQTQSNPQTLPSGQSGSELFSGGLNIGTIAGAEHSSDFSAQGSVVLNFRVEGNTQGNQPSVTTNSATDIETNSAQLRASGNGNGSPTNAHFKWGTSASSLNNTTNSQSVGSESFSADRTIFGLSDNTTYFYRAVATNEFGSVNGGTRSFTTDFQSSQQPTVNLSASPSSIDEGDITTVSWNTNNAVSCSTNASPHNSNWNGSVGTSGSRNISLNQDTTFTITCHNSQGVSATRSRTVNVDDFDSDAPFISFFASPSRVLDSGDVTTLYWTTGNAVSCNAFASPFNGNWSGSISTNGNRTISVDRDTTFSLTCQNSQGFSTTRSATVEVRDTDDFGAPSASTNPATSISGTSAQLNGVVFPNDSNTRAHFQWGRTTSLGFTTSDHNVGSGGSREISRIISGLSPNTTYYYRVVARNDDGFTQGNIVSFRTNSGGVVDDPPNTGSISVVTNVTTAIGATTGRLNGLVFPNGNFTTGYFEWGTTQSLGNTTQVQSLGTASVEAFGQTLSGLSPNTSYFYRAVAEGGSTGTVRGSILSFRTNSVTTTPPPTTGGPSTPTTRTVSVIKEVQNLDANESAGDSTTAERGDTVRFLITVQNTGNTTLEDVEIHDRIPMYVEFANSEALFRSGDEREVVWIVGDMVPGEIENVELDVIITDDAPNITLQNVARVESDNVTQNSNTALIRVADERIGGGVAAAFFGEGFFPDTLLGWLLLVAVILALVLLFRFLTSEMEARRAERLSVAQQTQEAKKS